MKSLLGSLCFLFILTSISFAQSGRRIQPVATPAPAAEDLAPDYSESAPQKKRPIYRPPLRNVPDRNPGTASKDSTTSIPTTQPVNETVEDVITVETDLITIPVSVFDRNGLYIPNLRQTDFKIFEDGKEQQIAYFGTTDKPFTVILLLDTSPSTEYKIEDIQRAATAFVDQLKPQDNVMVVEFDANVHVLAELTNDRQKIYKAIKNADFGGGTSLYDAVDFSLRKRLSKIEGRKAIVVFTDGVDTTSGKADYDSTIVQAEESEAMVFPIYYNTFFDNQRGIYTPFPSIGILDPKGTRAEDYALGKQYLEDLAAYTGGRVFRPESTPGGLTAAFEGIAEELRRQYNIGYIPNEDGKPGQRKQIKVRVNRTNLVLRARDSYIVGAKSKASAN